MVDGDWLIIQLVKKRPSLWRKRLQDKRNNSARIAELWNEIGLILKKDGNWVRNRWEILHLQYKTALKRETTHLKRDFKHFNDFSFLRNNLCSLKLAQSPVNNNSDAAAAMDSSGSDDTVEFSISQTELDTPPNSAAPDDIFVELSDSDEDKQQPEQRKEMAVSVKRPAESTVVLDAKSMKLEKKFRPEQSNKMSTTIAAAATSSASAIPTVTPTPTPVTIISNTLMCEDRIFGDLVTAMLMKMNDAEKRKAKKQIMDILL